MGLLKSKSGIFVGILSLCIVGCYLSRGSIPEVRRIFSKGSKPEAVVESQELRIKRVYETCEKYRNFTKSAGYRRHSHPFFVSYNYNWSYCKIGKIASTQLTQFFYILHHTANTTDQVLHTPRQEIHEIESREAAVWGYNSSFDKTRLILAARNPYTRLFSAYIDKMFVPSTSGSVRAGMDLKCKSEITFAEFLTHVARNTKRGIYEYHWTPIHYYCRPCDLNPAFIFKLETFKNDIEYIINITKLEAYKKKLFSLVLEDSKNWTGFGLIDDVMRRIAPINQHRTLDCMSWEQIVNRVWEALKIQGFISKQALFPSDMYRKLDDFKSHSILRQAVQLAKAKYPLSKSEKAKQRQDAMNRFYGTVESSIIEEIKEVYGPDFEMFGYSKDPPPW